jgi:hypothetical protein
LYSSHRSVDGVGTDSVQRAFSIQLSLVADQPRRRWTSVVVRPRRWRCSVSLRARARPGTASSVCHETGFSIPGPSLILASCETGCMARFEQYS